MTDLYDDRAERKYIRFLCGITTTHENLRRSPPRSISLRLGYADRVCSVNNRGKPEIRQACVAAMVNEDVRLSRCYQRSLRQPREGTCPFQVCVYHVVCVKVAETFRHVQ